MLLSCQIPSEGVTAFHPAPAPTGEQLQALLDKIITRFLRLLTRAGHLVEEEGLTHLADAHAADCAHAPGASMRMSWARLTVH